MQAPVYSKYLLAIGKLSLYVYEVIINKYPIILEEL